MYLRTPCPEKNRKQGYVLNSETIRENIIEKRIFGLWLIDFSEENYKNFKNENINQDKDFRSNLDNRIRKSIFDELMLWQ